MVISMTNRGTAVKFELGLCQYFRDAMGLLGIEVVQVKRSNTPFIATPHVQVVQRFNGPVQGSVVLDLPRETSFHWASRLLGGVDVFRVDAWFIKVLSDLCTSVVGRAIDNVGLSNTSLGPAVVYQGESCQKTSKKAATYTFSLQHGLQFHISVTYDSAAELAQVGNETSC